MNDLFELAIALLEAKFSNEECHNRRLEKVQHAEDNFSLS